MAYIRKRGKKGNETWQATVYVGLSAALDKNGNPKKIYEYITCDSEKECKAKARDLEKDIADGLYSNLQNKLFSEYADKWLEVNQNRLSSSSYRDYKMYINTHFKPFFGRFKLKDISEFNIKEYLNRKLRSNSNPKGLSSTTVRKHFFTLNMILRDALKFKNPCREIEPPTVEEFRPIVPTDEEFKLIHEAVKGTMDEPIILLAAWCGLREGEIFAIKSDDIDAENDTIRVDENMAITHEGSYQDKDPKSRKGKRTLVVQDYLMKLLKNIVDKHTKELEEKHIVELAPFKLFDMRPDAYSKRFSKIIESHNELITLKKKIGDAGIENFLKEHNNKSIKKNLNIQDKKIPDIRFHDLRHFHTTVLYENDVPDQYIAERLGDDIKTMKQVYQHLRLGKKQEINEQVKNLFNAK